MTAYSLICVSLNRKLKVLCLSCLMSCPTVQHKMMSYFSSCPVLIPDPNDIENWELCLQSLTHMCYKLQFCCHSESDLDQITKYTFENTIGLGFRFFTKTTKFDTKTYHLNNVD